MFLAIVDDVTNQPAIFPLLNIDLITSEIDEDTFIKETVDKENKDYVPIKYTIIKTKDGTKYRINESISNVWSTVFKNSEYYKACETFKRN